MGHLYHGYVSHNQRVSLISPLFHNILLAGDFKYDPHIVLIGSLRLSPWSPHCLTGSCGASDGFCVPELIAVVAYKTYRSLQKFNTW